ncbi:hypothetical protein Scep_004722 [Stephania cephalantha]|uniref:Uncharacterized protein n=1 Tax=Stephania cephalantha TaxID=152367 RepID=A0AAP0KUD4_9MAGN
MDDDEAEQQGVDDDGCWQLWLLCSCCLDVGACGIALPTASLSCFEASEDCFRVRVRRETPSKDYENFMKLFKEVLRPLRFSSNVN